MEVINESLMFAVQLCADGRTLLDTLQMPVSSCSCNSLTAKADYTEGASHVLDVVHEVRLNSIIHYAQRHVSCICVISSSCVLKIYVTRINTRKIHQPTAGIMCRHPLSCTLRSAALPVTIIVTFDFFSTKFAHQILLPQGTFSPVLVYLCFLFFLSF